MRAALLCELLTPVMTALLAEHTVQDVLDGEYGEYKQLCAC